MRRGPRPDLPAQELVNAIGRQLVKDVAPAELPLFGAMVQARAAGAAPATGSGHNDLLGFGLGEAVALMTPLILQFAQSFWDTLNDQAAEGALGVVGGVLKRLRERFGTAGHGESDEVRLTEEQLRRVREVGRRCAANLPIEAGQRELLVESLIGALAVPGESTDENSR